MTQAAGTTPPARIVIEELVKTFGGRGRDVPAVENVSFEVRQGEFVALIGPSGCGKSTILNMIAGLIPLTGGRIGIDGHGVTFGKPTPNTGYVFQRDTVYPWRTVKRTSGLGLRSEAGPGPGAGPGGRDLAFPTSVLVDERGVTRWIFQTGNYRTRASPQAIFQALEDLRNRR